MYLTREEERILGGEHGPAKAKALSVVVKVGDALGAEKLVEIRHAHISGISYGTIGEHGVSLLEYLADMGAKVSVETTVNPIGFDIDTPEILDEVGAILDRDFINGQKRILKALRRMGAKLTLTCTPYYLPEIRKLPKGSHVAWGESNAILYGNSVLGLRTNREGGPLALMAAISGRTYFWGLHLDDNRIPFNIFNVEIEKPLNEASAGVLGEMIATMHNELRPPYVKAVFRDEITLREFLAALGAAGSLGMAYIHGITPEGIRGRIEGERYDIDEYSIRRLLEKYMPSSPPEIIFIGCPHATSEDIRRLANLLKEKPKPKIKIIITLSRIEFMRALTNARDSLQLLREKNVIIARDTCLIVSPFGRKGKINVATNSYKALFYLSKRGLNVSLAPLEELIQLATGG